MCEVALYRSQQGALEDCRTFAIGAQHQDVKLTVKLFLGEGAGASQAQAQVREAVAVLLRCVCLTTRHVGLRGACTVVQFSLCLTRVHWPPRPPPRV